MQMSICIGTDKDVVRKYNDILLSYKQERLSRWCWWQRAHLPVQETKETQVGSLGWEDPLEEGVATHSRIFAWRIPMDPVDWGLQSIGLQSQTRLQD